ncbi:hypothetical protein Q7P37_002615 [Cladosporium fusiforme]
MSSFFTLPASQKKRKRPSAPGDAPDKRGPPSRRQQSRDESISGSDISDDDAPEEDDFSASESEDEDLKNEDPATKRIRLAEQYLANTQKEVLEHGGFDAAEIDQEILRSRMGERLAEDTAEDKGKLYRFIADDLDWTGAQHDQFRTDTKGVNGVAISGRHVYTVTQDRALVKWEIPELEAPSDENVQTKKTSRKPKKVGFTRGSKHATEHHQKEILCVAASQDGKFVATGGADNRLIIWDANTLKPLKIFSGLLRDNGHRDSVISVVFRRGTNQLFSASKDRTVKIWSLDELAYIETLFGHQDEVLDVSTLASETCVTVGARDRTARFWKVVEESQLVFRGGGPDRKVKKGVDDDGQKPNYEGSMERVACIDDETFITGADNGSVSLWSIHKKKPVFTYPLAHGLEPPAPIEDRSAEMDPSQVLDAEGPMILDPQPRWITALKAIPFSDVFLTGSWDGHVRAWRISSDKRRIEPLGPLGSPQVDIAAALEDAGISAEGLSSDALQALSHGAVQATGLVQGVINDLAVLDKDDRGRSGFYVLAAVGKEHKLGRWESFEGKNSAVLFNVPRKADAGEEKEAVDEEGDFAGFD